MAHHLSMFGINRGQLRRLYFHCLFSDLRPETCVQEQHGQQRSIEAPLLQSLMRGGVCRLKAHSAEVQARFAHSVRVIQHYCGDIFVFFSLTAAKAVAPGS